MHRPQVEIGGALADFPTIFGSLFDRLADPGIDDYRNELLWCPESPTLIEAAMELWADRGDLLDTVSSYTALRSVGTQRDRVVLNNRSYRQRLVC